MSKASRRADVTSLMGDVIRNLMHEMRGDGREMSSYGCFSNEAVWTNSCGVNGMPTVICEAVAVGVRCSMKASMIAPP